MANGGNGETRKTVAQVAKEVIQHKTELELVKKDIKLMGDIHARLDVTIDRLTEVSTSIKSMLAVHQQKIESQEKADGALFELIDKRRVEARNSIEDLHSRLSSVQRELREKMDHLEENLLNEFRTKKTEVDERVAVLEKWKWVFVGGCMRILYIVVFYHLLQFQLLYIL